MPLLEKTKATVQHNPFSIGVQYSQPEANTRDKVMMAIEEFLRNNARRGDPYFTLDIAVHPRMRFVSNGNVHSAGIHLQEDDGESPISINFLVVSGNLPAKLAGDCSASRAAVLGLAEIIATAADSYNVEITMQGEVLTYGVVRAESAA